MHVVYGANINTVWIDGLWRLKTSGAHEDSRNGKVIVLPEPLTSIYTRPWERVLFHPIRDANPWFHLMESLWMLAGREDVDFVAKFNPRMAEFSDTGGTLHGAYGYRWRCHFERDQLKDVVALLKRNPTTRQAVLAMWDPMTDLDSPSKDIPCNTHIYFRNNKGNLDMTVCCRSNDAVWGAYGANVVHFSMLHEFVARSVELHQGTMYQISNNFHIYERHWPLLEVPVVMDNYYGKGSVTVPLFELIDHPSKFLGDCENIENGTSYSTYFFQHIVRPALESWEYYKIGDMDAALAAIVPMPYCDWKVAMGRWLVRRVK